MNVFAPDIVAAITAHMNADHAHDCVAIVRSARPREMTIDRATMVGYDDYVVDFAYTTTAGSDHRITIEWPFVISDRASIRAAIVELAVRAGGVAH